MPRPCFKVTQKIKQRVQELSQTGINEAEIAKRLHIAYTTFKVHKRQFSSYIEKGREEYHNLEIPLVENALMKRAKGFEYEEVKTEQQGTVVNGQLINGKIFKTITKKIIPPDPACTFFYLSNRHKQKWVNPLKIDAPQSESKKEIPIVSHINKVNENKVSENNVNDINIQN